MFLYKLSKSELIFIDEGTALLVVLSIFIIYTKLSFHVKWTYFVCSCNVRRELDYMYKKTIYQKQNFMKINKCWITYK